MTERILLEAGTNEIELLVFRLEKVLFGINVAKVREIIQRVATIKIPYAPKSVVGTFKLRDSIFTLVNIGAHFDLESQESSDTEGMIIIVEFNNFSCGVLVDAVERIQRMKWESIQSPSQYLIDLNVPVTGVTIIDNETVLIADFEMIVGEILGVHSAEPTVDPPTEVVDQSTSRILLADDSPVVRASLTRVLQNQGLTNLTICSDGQQAWDTIEARRNDPDRAFDIILSDIEMPRMDGLHLTSRIKSDPLLKSIPVILFSSLISDDNHKKGVAVGADAQFSKPDIMDMVKLIEEYLEKAK